MHALERFKIHCLGIALLVLSSTNVKADEAFKYLNATCISEVGFLEISSSTLSNIGSNKDLSKHGLHSEGDGSITCHIPQTVLVEYRSTSPQARGMCGIGTRSFLSITIDGTLVAKDIVFAEDCFLAGTTKISIQNQQSFISLALEMHPQIGFGKPKRILYDSLILRLNERKFLSNRLMNLPVTMTFIRARTKELDR